MRNILTNTPSNKNYKKILFKRFTSEKILFKPEKHLQEPLRGGHKSNI